MRARPPAYLITDDTEQALIDRRHHPRPTQHPAGHPGQDLRAERSAACRVRRHLGHRPAGAAMGNLWLPHVYSPAQNPGDSSGVNQFGRWAYGPWFWPPTSNIDYRPDRQPLLRPGLRPRLSQWCEPPLMPGTPFNSMGMEAFNDTPWSTARPTRPSPWSPRPTASAS